MIPNSIAIDPLHKFKNNSPREIILTCGVLPYWVSEWTQGIRPAGYPDDISLKDYMDKRYGFGLDPMGEKATIDDQGVYRYPEDPDMYPLISFKYNDDLSQDIWKTVYFYQYAIVAIPDGDGHFITRMD